MKKYLAPIVIAVLLIIYEILYFGIIISLINSLLIKILIGIIPAAFAGIMIFVLIERIKEIRSGEEDDLGKY
ncbi:MAG: hypothetical protein IJE28_01835 [Oscillospiraceae bacterium]|nr:hypothetical protein [Oscillospiraceae bacterium]MBQ4545582.1 hypothetical protein [Oscillospiraceae bacterium]